MNVHILEEAAEDITVIHDWYETKRPGLGADFELCIEEILNRISSMPEPIRNGIVRPGVHF